MKHVWLSLMLALVYFTSTGQAIAAKRVALVIGNSAYRHTSPLKNPRHDAADMEVALKQLGFDVVSGFDLDKAATDRTIRKFAEKMSEADVGLFFYAGHGLQVSGENYIVPVDAKLTTVTALEFEMVRMRLVQRVMERATKTNIIFLDACRDNPLARNLARAMGTRSASIGKGLSSIESGVGTLISFSTQPGNVALDGAGRNSPFAKSLLKHIATPGEDLSTILIRVRNDVMARTANKQVPWEHSALRARFYFDPLSAKSPPAGSASRPLQSPGNDAARAWDVTKDTTSPAVLREFARRFKNTVYGDFALVRLRELEAKANNKKTALAPPTATKQQRARPLSTHLPRPRSPRESCSTRSIPGRQHLYCVSSYLSTSGVNKSYYGPENLFDGDDRTAWVEGRAASGDYGVGEWIIVDLGGPTTVTGIAIKNGYAKSVHHYRINSRIREIEVIFSNGDRKNVKLGDVRKTQKSFFEQPIEATWLQLRIVSVKRGTKYSDTAMNELRIIIGSQ